MMHIFHHSKQVRRWFAFGCSAIAMFFLSISPLAAQDRGCPEGSVTRQTVITGGVRDNYRLPAEPASRSPELDQLHGKWNQFDDSKEVRPFGHTFTELPCYITGAVLTVAIKPIGKPKGDDVISLGLKDRNFLWTQEIRSLNRFWPTETTLELDLSRLPLSRGTISIIDALASGKLDVYLGSSVAVDFMQLTITYCDFDDCNDNCIPDKEDIASGRSKDLNQNGIPDECETEPGSIEVICDTYMSVGLGTDCCAWLVLAPDVITTGNVGNYTVTNDFNGATGDLVTACFPIGVTQVTFIATTESGLTAQCTTVIHVYDNGAPVITPQ